MEPRVAVGYVAMVLRWGSTWAAIKIGVASVPPHVFAFERALTVAAILTLIALSETAQPQHWAGAVFAAFGDLVIGGSGIALVLNAWLFRRLRPTTVTLSQVLIPTQALRSGGFALGEAFSLRMLGRAALVVGAGALNARAGAPSRTVLLPGCSMTRR